MIFQNYHLVKFIGVEKLNTFHFGYNATKGGDGNLRVIMKNSTII